MTLIDSHFLMGRACQAPKELRSELTCLDQGRRTDVLPGMLVFWEAACAWLCKFKWLAGFRKALEFSFVLGWT